MQTLGWAWELVEAEVKVFESVEGAAEGDGAVEIEVRQRDALGQGLQRALERGGVTEIEMDLGDGAGQRRTVS